jgi:glycosyltransferase involved in cell wall biosynthesis
MAVVIGLGATPPPVNGASWVTAEVLSQLEGGPLVAVANTAVEGSRGVRYHVKRAWAHVRAGRTLIGSRRSVARVVYISCPAGLGLWYVVALTLLARGLGYRVVVHHHSMAYVDRTVLGVRALTAAVGWSGHNVLLSPAMCEEFDRRYSPRQRSRECSNAGWMDLGSAPADRRSSGDALRLGHLGTLTLSKGFGELLPIVASLREAGVAAELWLAGAVPTDADQEALDAGERSLGPDGFKHLGFVDGARKAQFFAAIDVFALPSRYKHEAQPLVVYEALRAGVPVIAYDTGCIGEQLRGSGLLVTPGDSFKRAVAPMLARLATDPEFRGVCRVEAREAFEAAVAEGRGQARALIDDLSGRNEQDETLRSGD